MKEKAWNTYEQVAQYLIDQFADSFQLGSVEGKQVVPGESGTDWEIDAKGLQKGNNGFVVIECKCYTKSRVNQEIISSLVYRINDTGASGGIIVSPLPLQRGAQILANHEGIVHVQLNKESTNTDYILQFLNKIFAGVSDQIELSDSVQAVIIQADEEKR